MRGRWETLGTCSCRGSVRVSPKRPSFDHSADHVAKSLQVSRLLGKFARTQFQGPADLCLIPGRAEDDNGRLLGMISLQHRRAGNSGNVEVQDNEARTEIGIIQHLQCLLPVASDVKSDGDPAICQSLLDEKGIPRVIFDKKDFNWLHTLGLSYPK